MKRLLVVATALVAVVLAAPGAAATLPPGFVDELLTDGVSRPTALAFTPDGRLLVTSQSGMLDVLSAGTLQIPPAVDLSANVCANSERGRRR